MDPRSINGKSFTCLDSPLLLAVNMNLVVAGAGEHVCLTTTPHPRGDGWSCEAKLRQSFHDAPTIHGHENQRERINSYISKYLMNRFIYKSNMPHAADSLAQGSSSIHDRLLTRREKEAVAKFRAASLDQ